MWKREGTLRRRRGHMWPKDKPLPRDQAQEFGRVLERPRRPGTFRIDIRPFGTYLYSDRGD